ncbi:MAG: UvrD-helicase domain-containing protein [bacterium]
MTSFDLLNSPLEGRNLIEASAGTGKTYTIAGLYLRLLLEQRLSVDQILVVTFTVAATEELRGRIRSRIRDALAAFASGSSNDDDFLAGLVKKCDDRREAELLLTNALRCFDEAVVFTIHGFCQRTLQEKAFECSSFFDTELITDQSSLMQEVVDDFWRIHAYNSPSQAFISFAGNKWGPRALAALVQASASRLNVLRVIPEEDPPDTRDLEDACTIALDKMRKLWPTVREEVEELLAGSQGLNRRKYPQASLKGWIQTVDKYLSAGSFLPFPGELECFGANALECAVKKGCQPPRHQLFILVDDLCSKLKELEAAFDQRLIHLKRKLLLFVREELPKRKIEQNIRSFDDLLLSLQSALRGKGGADLAQVIREKYRAALIDEFQDTDPIQYAIFKTIYPDRENILFLIGDPKQAIYSFRGADVFAYIEAAKDVEARYTLGTNWRSVPELIRAVNTIFSNRDNPFIFEDIPFHPVSPPAVSVPDERGKTCLELDAQLNAASVRECGTQIDTASLQKLGAQAGDAPLKEFGTQPGGAHIQKLDAQPDTASLQLWFLGCEDVHHPAASGKRISKGEAKKQLPEAVASEIGRLLRAGQKGQARIDGRPVTPGDIAVLVRTNEQARSMQEALQVRKIPSVLYSSESLFTSREAVELLTVLAAVAEPGREEKIKAALVTDLMGMSGNELASLIGDSAAWGMWLEKFRAYHELWARRQGFMIMASTLIAQEKIKSRLLAYRDGERRVTNLLHCMEVLHQAALENNLGIEGLVKWFTRQINEHPEKEEYQIRLETDEKAVKLVTIHKSKGLEYSIVFCPFCWSGVREEKEMAFFHDPESGHKTTIVLGSQNLLHARGKGTVKSLATQEALAEDLRLLYVALTRARYRCYLVWGTIGRAEASALAYLLHPAEGDGTAGGSDPVQTTAAWLSRLDNQKMLDDLGVLAQKAKGAITICPMPETSKDTFEAAEGPGDSLSCRTFSGSIPDDWHIASFSFLVSGREELGEWGEGRGLDEKHPVEDAGVDRGVDRGVGREVGREVDRGIDRGAGRGIAAGGQEIAARGQETAGGQEITARGQEKRIGAAGQRTVAAGQGIVSEDQEEDALLSPDDFPRGTRAGTCLHDILQNLDFAERTPEATEKLVQERLAAHGFDPAWTMPVCSLLDRVLATPLLDGQEGFSLSCLARKDRVAEMEFYLPLERITSRGLGRIFEAHGGPDVPKGFAGMLEMLDFAPVKGLLKGFIDLVFHFGGRYYLVDYKSNYLGPGLENYAQDILPEIMEREYYLLQYHLYTVAFHKYLARRVKGYDYEVHFGGIFYTFLRGMDPSRGSGFGIYRARPSLALIDSLDRYFCGSSMVLAGGKIDPLK